MEYQALEAMSRDTVQVTPGSLDGRVPRVMLKHTIPADHLVDTKTRPVTPPPDMMMRPPPRPEEPLGVSQRATQVQPFPELPVAEAPAEIEDHRFEQAVALLLLTAALYLVYLITA